MGEYEPNDSRDVTNKPGHVPGEPPRTGPREDEAREKARERAREKPREEARLREAGPLDQQRQFHPRAGTMVAQHQQCGRQFQSQSQRVPTTAGGPSSHPSAEEQARSEASPPVADEDGALSSSQADGPLAGNQPQGIDNRPGGARPEYDQYELNSPQNMHHEARDESEYRRQAEAQNDSSLDKGLGYAAEDGEEMEDAPDATARERDWGEGS